MLFMYFIGKSVKPKKNDKQFYLMCEDVWTSNFSYTDGVYIINGLYILIFYVKNDLIFNFTEISPVHKTFSLIR